MKFSWRIDTEVTIDNSLLGSEYRLNLMISATVIAIVLENDRCAKSRGLLASNLDLGIEWQLLFREEFYYVCCCSAARVAIIII